MSLSEYLWLLFVFLLSLLLWILFDRFEDGGGDDAPRR